jgi:3-methyladenine DNA glycosylase/8-oxoguanine DNA glycosylase
MGNLKNKQKYALHHSPNPNDVLEHDEENLELATCKKRKKARVLSCLVATI